MKEVLNNTFEKDKFVLENNIPRLKNRQYNAVRNEYKNENGLVYDLVVCCTICGRIGLAEKDEDLASTICVDCGNNEWEVLPFVKKNSELEKNYYAGKIRKNLKI